MRNRERAFGARLRRGVVIVLGVFGGFAAIDAILLFLFLLLWTVFVAMPSPYIGLLMFVALPFIAIIGGALAWTAYTVWNDRAPESPSDRHHAAV
jgi:hypothetical protein